MTIPNGGGSPGVVVPVRAFVGGFARLAGRLDPEARAELAFRLADRVVDAAAGMPVIVVSSAPEVRTWATGRGLQLVDDPGTLDGAAAAGRARVVELGCERVVVVHADLPRARSLAAVTDAVGEAAAVLVPDHHGDGTPVLSVPVAAPFRFAYGPGSFARHVAEAERVGLEVRVVHDDDLSFDVDEPADLERLGLLSPP
jgi:2-phospho-L-lactate guanylyltransferase